MEKPEQLFEKLVIAKPKLVNLSKGLLPGRVAQLEDVKIVIGNDEYKFDYSICEWIIASNDPKVLEQTKEILKKTEDRLEEASSKVVELTFISKEYEEKASQVKQELGRLSSYDDQLNEIVA